MFFFFLHPALCISQADCGFNHITLKALSTGPSTLQFAKWISCVTSHHHKWVFTTLPYQSRWCIKHQARPQAMQYDHHLSGSFTWNAIKGEKHTLFCLFSPKCLFLTLCCLLIIYHPCLSWIIFLPSFCRPPLPHAFPPLLLLSPSLSLPLSFPFPASCLSKATGEESFSVLTDNVYAPVM